jgi:hypothetical protein
LLGSEEDNKGSPLSFVFLTCVFVFVCSLCVASKGLDTSPLHWGPSRRKRRRQRKCKRKPRDQTSSLKIHAHAIHVVPKKGGFYCLIDHLIFCATHTARNDRAESYKKLWKRNFQNRSARGPRRSILERFKGESWNGVSAPGHFAPANKNKYFK